MNKISISDLGDIARQPELFRGEVLVGEPFQEITFQHGNYANMEKLPAHFVAKMPVYLQKHCAFYVNSSNQIKFSISLTNEFLQDMQTFYNLSSPPSQQEIAHLIEIELRTCLKNF